METRRLAVAARRPLEAHTVPHTLRSLLLLVLAFAIQILGLPQLITGTVVNGVLLAAALTSPFSRGVGGRPHPRGRPVAGHHPAGRGAHGPLIAAGDALLVVVFWAFHRTGRRWAAWLGAAVAAVLKAAFLGYAATHLVSVPPPVQAMMSTPQLITALSGAVLVLGVGPLAKRGFLRLIGWEARGPRPVANRPEPEPASEASGAALPPRAGREGALEASLPGAGRSSGASKAWPLRARRSSLPRGHGVRYPDWAQASERSTARFQPA